MIERTKNTLKNFLFKGLFAVPIKKLVFSATLFSVLGILVPLKFAHAGLGDIVLEIKKVFEFIFTLPFVGLILVIKLLLSAAIMVLGFIPVLFASLILNLVLSDQLIFLPYTHGGIVDIGWLVSRDIANMLLVMIVIVIAVSTMLGNESRGIRNLLPKLVIIALLLNFTKVIAGLVVDIANITTRYLLSPITNVGNMFMGLFGEATPAWQLVRAFTSLAKSFSGFNPGGLVQVIKTIVDNLSFSALLSDIVSTIAIILVAWMMTLALLAFAFIFFFRYIAIWLLVIISPLAFVAMILPDTAKFTKQWWDKFLHWAFIGIGPAFTLYLTAMIINARNDIIDPERGGLGVRAVAEEGGFLQQLLAPLYVTFSELLFWFVVIFFMFTGLMSSLKMNKSTANLTTKLWKKVQSTLTYRVQKKLAPKIGDVGSKVLRSKAARIPIIGEGLRTAGEAALTYEASIRERGNKSKGKFDQFRNTQQRVDFWLSSKNPDDWLGGAQSMRQMKGELDRARQLMLERDQSGYGGRSDWTQQFNEQFGRAFIVAEQRNQHRELRVTVPENPEVIRRSPPLRERMRRASTEEIAQISRFSLPNSDVMYELLNDISGWTGSTINNRVKDNPFWGNTAFESMRRTIDEELIIRRELKTANPTATTRELVELREQMTPVDVNRIRNTVIAPMSNDDLYNELLDRHIMETNPTDPVLSTPAGAAAERATYTNAKKEEVSESARRKYIESIGQDGLSRYIASSAPRLMGFDLKGQSVPHGVDPTTLGIQRGSGKVEALETERKLREVQHQKRELQRINIAWKALPVGSPAPTVPGVVTPMPPGITDSRDLDRYIQSIEDEIRELNRHLKGEI